MTISCPHCQQPMALPGMAVGQTLRRWLWLSVLGVVILIGAGGAWLKFAPRTGSSGAAKPSVIPNPPPADLQRMNKLAFWDFSLERREGSTITHAVARVLNEAGETRYGIEVQLELSDEVARVVGTAKDYIERLEPGQDVYLRALVIKRDAVSARVVQVTEQ